VRYEESVPYAQALLGTTSYPEGHPLFVYAHNACGIQHHLSAWALQVTGSEYAVCAFRDILYVLAMLLPVFLIASHLARTTRAGHLAALLVFIDAPAGFGSFGSISMWPYGETTHTIGMGYALFTLYALLARACLPAGILLGLMPMVYVGHIPPLALLAAINLIGEDRVSIMRFAGGIAVGMLGCGLFYLYHRAQVVPIPTEGAYAPHGDPWEVWGRFMFSEQYVHGLAVPPRFGPPAAGSLAIFCLLVLSSLGMWRHLPARRKAEPWALVMLYANAIAAIFWIIVLAEMALGPVTPYWLVAWMPYRLTDPAVLLLLAATGALLGQRGSGMRAATFCVIMGTLVGPILVVLAMWLSFTLAPDSIYEIMREYMQVEGPLFFLIGAAAARGVIAGKPGRWITGVLMLAAWAVLLLVQPYFGTCAAIGFVVFLVTYRDSVLWRTPERYWKRAAALCGAPLVVAVLAAEFISREEIAPGDHSFAEILDERGDDEVMVLTPFTRLDYQLSLGHPVFATIDTRNLVAHVPEMAPTLEQMFSDVYDVHFGKPSNLDVHPLWEARKREEWIKLSAMYGFRYVIVHGGASLDLPALDASGRVRLYAIPKAEGEKGHD
jgi:hypothetical protein